MQIEGAPQALIDEVWDDCYRAVPHFGGGLVFDVGAGVGTFSTFAVHHGCKVLAVEPHPESARLLQSNTTAAVTIMERAVGDGSFIDWREAGHGWQTFPGTTEPTLRWEDIAQPCDVLKVDCEGAEYPFLVGADLSMVGYVAVEFHVWAATPQPGLGVRPEPMPMPPFVLLEWLERTHKMELVGDLEAGGLMLGSIR